MGRKIFVAVHGMGDQVEFDTAQPIAERLTSYLSPEKAATRFSYGTFSSAIGSVLAKNRDAQRNHCAAPTQPFLGVLKVDWLNGFCQSGVELGVTELYWADICRADATDGYRLQETVSWAQSVVDKVRNLSHGASNPNFATIQAVFSELGHGIDKLNQFLKVAPLLGLPAFELKTILTQFLGDVQYVTEFQDIRSRIIERFETQMGSIELEPEDEIIIVSHSEGTVVSFLGLLTALSSKDVPDKPVDWRTRVTGWVTMGSPIDKHLLIWGDLWKSFEGQPANCPKLTSPILWHNYYDYGDPVGFDLDEARAWLQRTGWDQHFNFSDTADHGFTRYPFPGKAHIDYWQDDDVFAHIFEHVAALHSPYQPSPAPAPATLRVECFFSYVVPYLMASVLMASAIYFLVTGTHVAQGLQVSSKIVFMDVVTIGCLLSGLTVAGRIPRLLRVDWCSVKWWAWSVAIFALCAYGFYWWLPKPTAENIGLGMQGISKLLGLGINVTDNVVRVVSIAGAAIVAVVGCVSRKNSMKVLVRLGSGIVLGLCASMVLLTTSTLQSLKSLKVTDSGIKLLDSSAEPSAWPAVIGGVAFLYLWYLATVVFDLTFVWHLYIKGDLMEKRLGKIIPHKTPQVLVSEANK